MAITLCILDVLIGLIGMGISVGDYLFLVEFRIKFYMGIRYVGDLSTFI